MQPANLWLSRYAKCVVGVAFLLIYYGGMTTTLDAGLSVPDWPTTFGHNMFTFPFHKWIGLPYWEHSHRILGSLVGLLTTILAVWIWFSDSRKWVRITGILAFFTVVVQGVMGGLRVTQINIAWAIAHACLAQGFLCILVLLALALSPAWSRPVSPVPDSRRLLSAKRWGWALFIVTFIQLFFGAVMRHLKAGLAIPTFPLTPEGKLMPSVHSMAIDIHFTHRFWAVVVTVVAIVLAVKIFRWARDSRFVIPAATLLFLLALQIILGANIIWSSRASWPTTMHVVNGAALLVLALIISARASHALSTPSKS